MDAFQTVKLWLWYAAAFLLGAAWSVWRMWYAALSPVASASERSAGMTTDSSENERMYDACSSATAGPST